MWWIILLAGLGTLSTVAVTVIYIAGMIADMDDQQQKEK